MSAREDTLFYRKDVMVYLADGKWWPVGRLANRLRRAMTETKAMTEVGKKNLATWHKKLDKTISQLIEMSDMGRIERVRDICTDLVRDSMVWLEFDVTGAVHRVKLRPKKDWLHHSKQKK